MKVLATCGVHGTAQSAATPQRTFVSAVSVGQECVVVTFIGIGE